ncbi:diguanylate cyclase [Exilibacterium tricleocarpae]|uniref:diguanylate cyclase n=1 Tax=Exilibacterium tricleocarpae TaxID=2591008 RepID=A0A545TLZ1_9GAMM|nr:GGDEF domain-containing protein [Exilibacterium tricleocarpae]TQV78249.1 diguanylate cyclase [Exilibacterium tricleocarpae]
MRRGYWLILVATILLVTGYHLRFQAPATITAEQGTANLGNWDFTHQGPVSLSGDWLFFPGQLHTPASFLQTLQTTGGAGRAPQTLPVPATWNKLYRHQSSHPLAQGRGYGTYALKLTGTGHSSLGLVQQPACTSSRSYFFPASAPSSQPVSTLGHVAATAPQSLPHQQPVFSALRTRPGAPHYLLVQVANFDHRLGGLCRAVYLGTQQQLFDLQLQRLIGQGLTIAIIFSMTIYAFAIYFYTPHNRSSLWLGLWALCATLYFWTRANFWEQAFGTGGTFGFAFHYTVEYCSLLLMGPFIIYFHHHAYRTRYVAERLLRGNFAAVLLLCLAVLVTPVEWFTRYYTPLMWLMLAQLLLAGYILLRALHDRQKNAVRLGISALPLFFTIPVDLFANLNGKPSGSYTELAMVFFVFMQGLVQGRRLGLVIVRSQHLSDSLAEEVKHQTASLEEKNYELLIARTALEEANRDLKALSITDGLTGAYNRLYFDRQFLIEWQRARRERCPLSLVLVDIDHFKALNDNHGHLAGDQGLKAIVSHLHAIFRRASDVVCRYGGEEFVVLLPNTSPDQAAAAAEELRALVASTPLHYHDQEIYYTVSIGVGGLPAPGPSQQPLDLLSAADRALYQVKRDGRNGVGVADVIAADIRA